MIGEIQEYFNMINDLRDQVKQQLEGLSREALDWRPTSSAGELATNSMAVIAAHVAGSEPFWMKEIVGGQPIHRDRASEFVIQGVDVSELTERLDAGGRITTEIFSSLKADALEENRTWKDQPVSVRWCILHVIDHMAQHLGHMQLTRQLWLAKQVG